MGRCNVYKIHRGKEFLHLRIGFYFPSVGKFPCTLPVGIIRPLHADSADKFCLHEKSARDPAGSYDANPLDLLLLLPQHCAGDVPRSLQVNHPAIILQIIKISHPVGTNGKNIDIIFFDIVKFLPLGLLDDNLIGKPGLSHIFDARQQGIYYIQLSPGPVVGLRGHAHDQVISQRLRPLKQPVMPFMEKVECAVCNYPGTLLFH